MYNYIYKNINFEYLSESVKHKYTSNEWEIPKGRRNIRNNVAENDIMCAKREFNEETGLNNLDYKLLNIKPLSYEFYGSNNIKYKHIYFIAEIINKNKKLYINPKKIEQHSEISNIGYFTLKESIDKFRNYNYQKKNILFYIQSIIDNFK